LYLDIFFQIYALAAWHSSLPRKLLGYFSLYVYRQGRHDTQHNNKPIATLSIISSIGWVSLCWMSWRLDETPHSGDLLGRSLLKAINVNLMRQNGFMGGAISNTWQDFKAVTRTGLSRFRWSGRRTGMSDNSEWLVLIEGGFVVQKLKLSCCFRCDQINTNPCYKFHHTLLRCCSRTYSFNKLTWEDLRLLKFRRLLLLT